jgi:hypothetical protein
LRKKEKSNRKEFVSHGAFSGDIVSGFGMRPGVTQALWPKNLQLSDFPVGASTTVQIRTEPDLTFGNISQVISAQDICLRDYKPVGAISRGFIYLAVTLYRFYSSLDTKRLIVNFALKEADLTNL